MSKAFPVLICVVALVGLAVGCSSRYCPTPSAEAQVDAGPQVQAAQPQSQPAAEDVAVQPSAPDRPFVLRVNCGAYEPFTDKFGRVWLADKELEAGGGWGAVNGMTVERTWADIEGTDIPQVYQYERYSMESYVFSVPNGTYTVRLHFAETFEGITGPGERVFSVSVQGQTVLKDLDLFQVCGGAYKALVKEYKGVEVKDGRLVIGFTPNIENPEINGIEIIGQ